jgi:2-keto-4-pentenoate hydratase/2-oxohepta-3-ene-1,7-dioic acid hydratase in catechol pathway
MGASTPPAPASALRASYIFDTVSIDISTSPMIDPLPAAAPLLGTGLARVVLPGGTPALAFTDGTRVQPVAAWQRRRGVQVVRKALFDGTADFTPLATVGLDDDALPLGDCAAVLPPWRPRQVFCTIGNYRGGAIEAALDAQPDADEAAREQVREATQAALDSRLRDGAPYTVAKPVSALAGPFDALRLPAGAQTLDWEVELGVVMGRPAYQVPVHEALACVAGYCTVNDVTLRERLFRADLKAMGTDFLQAKGGPGWLPLGPFLLPAAAVPDPLALRMTLRLNGQVMQDAWASDMLFDIAAQVSYLSQHVQLLPGDLLCTGSPAGFGQHHGRFLQPGDVMEAEVHGLGAQRTPVI